MERIFLIIGASVLSGGCASLAVLQLYKYLARLELEKKFKERSDKVSEAYKKGFVWNILFIAGKLGEHIKRIKHVKLDEHSEDVSKQLKMLGGVYASLDEFSFIGVEVLAAIASVAIVIVALDITNILFLLIAAAFGFFVPLFWIKEQVKAKHKAIFRQIPDVLDMLTLMVEAGLDFNTSLSKVLAIEKGRLIDEFQAAQQEVKLGKSRIEALEAMAERVKYQPLTQVINALTLAIKTGGSLGPTLRTLSEQFRVERSQAAEKMAQEAPIKLMGPLVLLIFPTVFIILFGPIVLSFIGK